MVVLARAALRRACVTGRAEVGRGLACPGLPGSPALGVRVAQRWPRLAAGRHRPPGVRHPGAAGHVAGGHQHLGLADGAAEGAAAEAQHLRARPAPGHAHDGGPRPRRPRPQPGDHLLVPRHRASGRLLPAPHHHGRRGPGARGLSQLCLPPGALARCLGPGALPKVLVKPGDLLSPEPWAPLSPGSLPTSQGLCTRFPACTRAADVLISASVLGLGQLSVRPSVCQATSHFTEKQLDSEPRCCQHPREKEP